jgi:hypothetical protein
MKDNKDKCHPYLLRLYKDIYNCDEKIKKNEINEKFASTINTAQLL